MSRPAIRFTELDGNCFWDLRHAKDAIKVAKKVYVHAGQATFPITKKAARVFIEDRRSDTDFAYQTNQKIDEVCGQLKIILQISTFADGSMHREVHFYQGKEGGRDCPDKPAAIQSPSV